MFNQLLMSNDSLSVQFDSLTQAAAIEEMVNNYVAIQAKREQPYEHNDNPDIRRAFNRLGQSISSETLQEDLRVALADSVQKMKGWGKQITVPNLLNDGSSNAIAELFETSVTIPAEYGKEAWELHDNVLERVVRTKLGDIGDWFDEELLDDEVRDMSEGQREQQVDNYIAEIKPIYQQNYYAAWNRFLGEIHLKEFDDLEEAEEAMELLSEDPQSEQRKFNLQYWQEKFTDILSGSMKAPFPFRVLFSVVKEQTPEFQSLENQRSYRNLRFVHDLQTSPQLVNGWEEMIQNYGGHNGWIERNG